MPTETIASRPTLVLATLPQAPAGAAGQPGTPGTPGDYGWANQQDGQYTQAAPFWIPVGQETQITVDGTGAQSDSTHLRTPFLGWQFWRGNRFYPLNPYDKYDLRLTFYGQSLAIGNSVKLRLDIGPPIGTFYEDRKAFDTEAGEARLFTFVIPFYDKATFLANGGAFLLTPISAPMSLWSASIYLDVTGSGA